MFRITLEETAWLLSKRKSTFVYNEIFSQKTLAFSLQCHTMERRQDEKKTGTTKFTGRFFVRQRIVLSGNRRSEERRVGKECGS